MLLKAEETQEDDGKDKYSRDTQVELGLKRFDDARSSIIVFNLAEVPRLQVHQKFAEDVIDGVVVQAIIGCFGFDGEKRSVVVFWMLNCPVEKFGGVVDSNVYVFFRPADEVVAVPMAVPHGPLPRAFFVQDLEHLLHSHIAIEFVRRCHRCPSDQGA
jgi:hypothetical protein